MPTRNVLRDPTAVARAAAEWVVEAAARATEARGAFRLGLSGGRTPEPLYRLLAGREFNGRVDWRHVHALFADERDAPPTEPESNYWWIRKLLLEPAEIPPASVHRMKADAADLEAAAREYETRLTEPLDLLVLGVGEDGHTASLFPGSPLLDERTLRVAAVHDSPKPPPRRITLTPRAIAEARAVLVLVTGSGKSAAVGRALAPAGETRSCPARLLCEYEWLMDEAAAGA